MSVSGEHIAAGTPESFWETLTVLDTDHQTALRNHEQLRRKLDQTIADRDELALRMAWDAYREAVADLDKVTESLETLRLAAG